MIMTEVKIRKVPDCVVDHYRSRAESAGRSLEEELRILLTETVIERQRQFGREVDAFSERLRAKYGEFADSTPGIVEERNERG